MCSGEKPDLMFGSSHHPLGVIEELEEEEKQGQITITKARNAIVQREIISLNTGYTLCCLEK